MNNNNTQQNKKGFQQKGKNRGFQPRGNQPLRLKEKNLRKRKVVKKAVRKALDQNPRMEPEEVRLLKKTAKKAVQKERRLEQNSKIFKVFSNVILQTPLQPTKREYVWDWQAFDQFVLLLLHELGQNTDLFATPSRNNSGSNFDQSITPAHVRLYAYMCALSHIKRVGVLTGDLGAQVPLMNENLNIPNAIAKWLEYYCPYHHLGCTQTTTFNYIQDWTANYYYVGPGDEFNYGGSQISYDGYPQIVTGVEVPITGGNPLTAPISSNYYSLQPFQTPLTLMNFIGNEKGILAISLAFETNGVHCVSSSWLAKKGLNAPDGSAYSSKAGTLLPTSYASGPTVAPISTLVNLHKNFCPQLSMIMRLYTPVTDEAAIESKPLQLPIYDYSALYSPNTAFPFYSQPASTLVWLACRETNLRYGHVLDSFALNGKKRLTTLYPNPRNCSIATVSTLVAHCYQQLQMMQDQAGSRNINQFGVPPPTGGGTTGANANEYKSGLNWWSFMTSFCMALQRRLNENYVCHFNYPLFLNNGNSYAYPQSCKVPRSALNVLLPVILAEAIDSIGAVVDSKGVLQVPVCVFAQNGTATPLSAPLTASTGIFPLAWSAFGFTTAPWPTYPYGNNAIIAVANASGTTVVPVNANLDGVILNQATITSYVGYLSTNVLFPFYFTGPFIRKIHDIYSAFVKSCQYVNSPLKQFVPPADHKLARSYTMLSEVVLQFTASAIEPLMPLQLSVNNVSVAAPGVTTNNLSVFRSPVVGINSTVYLNPPKTFLTMLYGWVGALDQVVTRSNTDQTTYRAFALAAMQGVPPPAINTPSPVGKFQIAPLSGSALNSATAELVHQCMDSDSTFAKSKAGIDKARSSISQLMPKSMLSKLEGLTYFKPFETLVAAAAQHIFDHRMVPNVQPHHLGKLGKGMPSGVAPNVAVLDSGAGVASSDQHAISDEPTQKKKTRKFDGRRLKKVAHALKSATETVSKGMNVALKTAGQVSQLTEAASAIIGAL